MSRKYVTAYITLLIMSPFMLIGFLYALAFGFIVYGFQFGYVRACKFISWVRGDGWQ